MLRFAQHDIELLRLLQKYHDFENTDAPQVYRSFFNISIVIEWDFHECAASARVLDGGCGGMFIGHSVSL
jgi:hypothetical protein